MSVCDKPALETLRTLLLTAAAAAGVQSCADGAADSIEPPSEPRFDQAVAPVDPCPQFTRAVAVGGELHCQLSGEIDADVRLITGLTYQVSGPVRIGSPLADAPMRTLAVEPGVTVYSAGFDGALEIAPGSRIEARGAPGAPVVFTSAYDAGYAEALSLPPRRNPAAPRGEWAGVSIAGSGAGAASVILRDVQIRFAGAYVARPDGAVARAPALALVAVEAGSEVRGVTIVNAFGDGVRLVGGTVEVADVAVMGAGDDGVEWSDGYTGLLRDVAVRHDAALGDGDNGFEGHGAASAPRLVNVSAFGDAKVSNAGLSIEGGDVAIDGATIAGGFARAGFDVAADAYRRIAARDITRVIINADDAFPALSVDRDDAALGALFAAGGGNRIEPLDWTATDALIAAAAREAPAVAAAAPEAPPEPAGAADQPAAVEAPAHGPQQVAAVRAAGADL